MRYADIKHEIPDSKVLYYRCFLTLWYKIVVCELKTMDEQTDKAKP